MAWVPSRNLCVRKYKRSIHWSCVCGSVLRNWPVFSSCVKSPVDLSQGATTSTYWNVPGGSSKYYSLATEFAIEMIQLHVQSLLDRICKDFSVSPRFFAVIYQSYQSHHRGGNVRLCSHGCKQSFSRLSYNGIKPLRIFLLGTGNMWFLPVLSTI